MANAVVVLWQQYSQRTHRALHGRQQLGGQQVWQQLVAGGGLRGGGGARIPLRPLPEGIEPGGHPGRRCRRRCCLVPIQEVRYLLLPAGCGQGDLMSTMRQDSLIAIVTSEAGDSITSAAFLRLNWLPRCQPSANMRGKQT